MKRHYFRLIALAALTLSLAACKRNTPAPAESPLAPSPVRTETTTASEATQSAPAAATEDLSGRVRSEILKNCEVNIANTFTEKNKVVRYKIDAILNRNNDAAQLKSLFSVPRLKADFTSFDAASVQALSEMVTSGVASSAELGAADRRDLACQVAEYVHLFYIENPTKAPADSRGFYAKFGSGSAPAAATSTRSIAPASNGSDRLPTAPAISRADIDDIKAEIKLLADDSYEHEARLNALPRQTSDTTIWIFTSIVAGLLLLFILFYRINRNKTQAAIAALRQDIANMKANQKAEMEQMIENLLPILLDRREADIKAWESGTYQLEAPAYEVVEESATPQVNFWVSPNENAPEEVADAAEPEAEVTPAQEEAAPVFEFNVPAATDENEVEEAHISEDAIASLPALSGGEIRFSAAPQGGYFAADSLSADFVAGVSLYQLYIHADNPSLASFSIVEDAQMRQIALADSVTHLIPGMVLDGLGEITKASELYVAEIGEAEREGDNWRITRKGVVEYQ